MAALKKKKKKRTCSHSGKNKSSTLCSGNFQVMEHFSTGIKEKINTFARQTINPSQHFGGSCWQPALWLFNWWPQPGWVGVQSQLWDCKTAIAWLSVGCCRESLSWPLWKLLRVEVGTACAFCSWVAVVLVSATVIVSSSSSSNVPLVGTTVWTAPILRDYGRRLEMHSYPDIAEFSSFIVSERGSGIETATNFVTFG